CAAGGGSDGRTRPGSVRAAARRLAPESAGRLRREPPRAGPARGAGPGGGRGGGATHRRRVRWLDRGALSRRAGARGYGRFGGELGEGSFYRGNKLCGLEVGLHLRRRPHLTDPPPARHRGTLQSVACGVANGEVEVVPHCAEGDPVRPAAPDPEKDLLRDLF